jgi:cyclase
MTEIEIIEDVLYMYTTPFDNWWSNHVFFETEKMGVVVYDVPFLNEDGEAFWKEIKKNTSREISLFILSHGHSDHWSSMDFFSKVVPKAAILSAKETANNFRIMGKAYANWTSMFGTWKDIPSLIIEPTETFETEKKIDAGDFTLELYTTGPAEDTEHTVIYIPELKVLIAGDVIYNGYHPWNEEERDGHWLRVLDRLRTLDVGTVIPGHGPVCGPEIFDIMEEWLILYQDLRLKYAGRYGIKDMPHENRRKMMEELKAAFPDWVEGDLRYSCGEMLAPPYSYGKNRYSASTF